MAYQTGTVANSAALKTVIKDFGVANGWTLTGEFLSKGDISVKFDTNFQFILYQFSFNGANSIVLYFNRSTVDTYGYTAAEYGLSNGSTITLAGAVPTAYNGTYVISGLNSSNPNFDYCYATLVSGTGFSTNPGNLTVNPTITGEFGTIFMAGATSADGTTNYLDGGHGISINPTYWPLTYHLFANTNPDIIVCSLVYNINYSQFLMFGNIKKVHDSAFVGGGFYAGSYTKFHNRSGLAYLQDNLISFQNYTACGPFIGSTNLHAELDGLIWNSTCHLGNTNICNLARSPNTYNSQTHLVPVSIYINYASTYQGYIGQVEHVRYLRNDNYEVGDIITIGTDKWKVFPVWKKDITARAGYPFTNVAQTGTLAYAVRYDGP